MAALPTPGAVSDDEYAVLSAEGDTTPSLPASDTEAYALVQHSSHRVEPQDTVSYTLSIAAESRPVWRALYATFCGLFVPPKTSIAAPENLRVLSALRVSLNYDPRYSAPRHTLSADYKKQKKFAWCQFSSVETFASVRCALPERPPTLFLVEYGRSWELDVFVFPHNAIRAELIDLYDILEGIARLGLNLQLIHIHRLAMWWQVFERFLSDYFRFEDKVLLPWVYGEGDRVAAVHNFRLAMARRRNRVNELALEVTNVFSLFNCRPGGEILPLLFRSIRELLPRLLSYLCKEERYLPRVLASHHERDEKPVMERNMVTFFQNTDDPSTSIHLLTRWIPSRDEVRRIKRKYLKRRTRFWRRRRAKYAALEHVSTALEFKAMNRVV